MVDRSKYTSKYAPPAKDLMDRWKANLPSSQEIESFFLNELCESSEHKYFLCVADIFLAAVTRQTGEDQLLSLTGLYKRLLDAAEFARGVEEKELKDHFNRSIHGFVDLYSKCVRVNDMPSRTKRLVGVGFLTLQAISLNDLALARVIAHSGRELGCPNPACEPEHEIRCPKCDSTITPYEYHENHHNMRNVPGHPRNDF